MMIRLIYASTATDGVDLNEFKRILSTAQNNNGQRDLTGMLIFNSKVFLQALEGSRESVNDLYAKLTKDPRHYNLVLLKMEYITERRWSEWSMGFAAPSANNKALFLKHSTQSTFNPYGMSPDAAEKLLIELSTNLVAVQNQAANSDASNDGDAKDAKPSVFGRFFR
jgi:Sensors of blue-light using FAD